MYIYVKCIYILNFIKFHKIVTQLPNYTTPFSGFLKMVIRLEPESAIGRLLCLTKS